MTKVAVVFADGCEEVEGLSVVYVLRRLDIDCDMVGLDKKEKFDLKEVQKKAQAICDRYHFNLNLNQKVYEMSVSQKQTLEIVKVLYRGADILILDEPFSGLDPVNAELLKEVVRDEMKRGKIILFSSHQMNYIEEFCNEIAILNGGHIVLSGNLRKIRHQMAGNDLLVRSSMQEQILKYYGDRAFLTEDGAIRIKLNDTEDCRREMQLLTTKWDVNEVRIFEPSLNDIFVQTTRDQI